VPVNAPLPAAATVCRPVRRAGIGVSGAGSGGGEDRREVWGAFGVGEHEDLVAGLQPGGALDGDELAVADHQADPRVLPQVELADRAPVGRGAGRHQAAAQAAGFVPELHAQAPRSGFDGAHRHAEPSRDDRHEAALDDDGERHHHDDDRVQPGRVGLPGGEQEGAEQDRDGTLEPGPQHEQPLPPAQPDREQQQADPQRADHERQQDRQRQADAPRGPAGQGVQADGEAEHDERHDLGQAGQGGVEPLDLPLVGGTGVSGEDAGDEHRRNPEPCATAAAP
jgi:hypothetical protein